MILDGTDFGRNFALASGRSVDASLYLDKIDKIKTNRFSVAGNGIAYSQATSNPACIWIPIVDKHIDQGCNYQHTPSLNPCSPSILK